MEGLQRAENPTQSTQKFLLGETLMGEGVAVRGLRPLWRLRRRDSTSAPHAMLSSCPLHVTRVCSLAAALRPSAAASTGSAAFGRAGAFGARWHYACYAMAPAGTMLAMQFSRAGQCNLARLLARKP